MTTHGTAPSWRSVSSLTLLLLVVTVPAVFVALLVLLGGALGVNPAPA